METRRKSKPKDLPASPRLRFSRLLARCRLSRSPDRIAAHVTRSGELSVAETADVLRLYRMRLAALAAGGRHSLRANFQETSARRAARRSNNLHSQLAALTMVPDQVARGTLAAASEYFSPTATLCFLRFNLGGALGRRTRRRGVAVVCRALSVCQAFSYEIAASPTGNMRRTSTNSLTPSCWS